MQRLEDERCVEGVRLVQRSAAGVGALVLPDPRASLIEIGPFKLSWVEIILLLSAVIASAEILKVSEPGVDNTACASGTPAKAGPSSVSNHGRLVAACDSRASAPSCAQLTPSPDR